MCLCENEYSKNSTDIYSEMFNLVMLRNDATYHENA